MSGMSCPTFAVLAHHLVVEGAVPEVHGQLGVDRQLHVGDALGDAHVAGMHHAGHTLIHEVQILQLGLYEDLGVEPTVT